MSPLGSATLPLWLVLGGCAPPAEVPTGARDHAPTEEGAMREEELGTQATWLSGWAYYLPMGWFGGLAASLSAPNPPYEIRAISANMVNQWEFTYEDETFVCDSSAPIRLGVWISDEATPERLPEENARALVTAAGAGESAGEYELVTGVVDPPVVVDASGTLVVAVLKGPEREGRGPCVAADDSASDEILLMREDDSEDWLPYTGSAPGLRVLIARSED